mgnify:CR=1 FL=1
MKDFLKKLVSQKEQRAEELREAIEKAETANEVRSLGDELKKVECELKDAREKIEEAEKKEADEARKAALSKSNFEPNKAVASADMNKKDSRSKEDDEEARSSMEYRKAFMNYVQRGTKSDILQFNEIEHRDSTGTSTDLGVFIPMTVIQEIIKGVEKVYDSLYSKVKKTNLKGGVKYPIGSFKAQFKRITEAQGVSSRQHAGEITGYVEFSYNIGEIRLARTLLQTVLSVPVFEQEFAKVVVESYVEAMDKEIINGVAANNQCEGILTEAAKSDSRIPASNIISFTAAEMADWTKWEEKFFAEIPLSLENASSEFVFAKQTYVANLCTMKDNNNQPIKKAGFD